MRRSTSLAGAALAVVIAFQSTLPALAQEQPAPTSAPPPADAQPSSDEKTEPDPKNREAAEASFNKGLKLQDEEAWTAALAEFLRSRELFPTRAATNNVAFCLRKLKRFDEALDMYETLLREYPNLAQEKKQVVQKEIAELRDLVGTIDIRAAEPGASIVVDGRARADYPLIDPLRVAAGTHTVRLFKQGFQPFETSVEVAGGITVTVEAKMPALVASGMLRIAEKAGQKMDVLVDGATVGVTPWEGTIAVGEHVVQLLGDGDLGTLPAAAIIKKDDVTALTLEATPLESELGITVSPAGATVRIDSVVVGHGIWDGHLTKGAHVVEALLDGYYSKREEVALEKGERKELKLTLERDDDAAAWKIPSKIVLDITGGVALTPSFGGDVSATCTDNCSQGIGFGGALLINGTYEFGNRFGIGLTVGALQVSQTVEDRPTSIEPVGLDPRPGTATDELRMRAIVAGIHASYRFGEDFPIRLRLGAGALISQTRSIRDGVFAARDGSSYVAPTLLSQQLTPFIYIDPEASVGFRFAQRFEVSVGVQGLFVIPPSPPTWEGDGTQNVVIQGDGLAHYASDETTMGFMVFVIPSAALRASF
ncbi:MAG: PEGA domain-containing protein [Polyangiaceae bacterium]